MEAERVRREEEARLKKKLGAKEAAKRAEKAAQVSVFMVVLKYILASKQLSLFYTITFLATCFIDAHKT